MENTVVWEATELRPERNTDWFWTVGTIALFGAVASILYGNWLFSIVLVLGGATVILENLREARPVRCTLNNRGVVVNSQFFPYNNLTSFWVEDGHGHHYLLLIVKSAMLPHLWVPLPHEETDRVRAYLKHHIPEVRHEKTFAEALGDRLRL